MTRNMLDSGDIKVLRALHDALIELSAKEGLPEGRVSPNFQGLTHKELAENTGLTRHYVSRAVFRLSVLELLVAYPSGRKTLHNLSPLGFQACTNLFRQENQAPDTKWPRSRRW